MSLLGDRGCTAQPFPLIKTTDSNLSCSVKSIFIYLFKHSGRVCANANMQVFDEGRSTWNTVRMAAGKVSKFVVGVSSSKLNLEESFRKKETRNII